MRPKAAKNWPPLNCKSKRQIGRLHERFFDFDLGFVVVIELENDVGEAFEIGIDRAIERELDVARVESALLRIVIADFERDRDRERSNRRARTSRRTKCSCKFCPPPAIVIGAVSDAPAPVEEMVSVEVVTEASVVGNGVADCGRRGRRIAGNGEGAGTEATTDSSFVGNDVVALPPGEGVGVFS